MPKVTGHHWFEALDAAAPKTGVLANTSYTLPISTKPDKNDNQGLRHCRKGPGRFITAAASSHFKSAAISALLHRRLGLTTTLPTDSWRMLINSANHTRIHTNGYRHHHQPLPVDAVVQAAPRKVSLTSWLWSRTNPCQGIHRAGVWLSSWSSS